MELLQNIYLYGTLASTLIRGIIDPKDETPLRISMVQLAMSTPLAIIGIMLIFSISVWLAVGYLLLAILAFCVGRGIKCLL